MQYANPDFNIINFKFAVSAHNVCGILLTASYMFFVLGNIFSFNGNYYRINRKGWMKRLYRQFRYYTYGIFKHEAPPFQINKERKFNPMQKFTYVLILYLIVPVIIISGWALLLPELIFIDKIFGTSGIHFTDLLHIISGFILSVFMVVHIYFCTLTKVPGASFRAMINGWHE
jgi:thiosulfate reductase cytochrome b subunit